MSDIYSTPDADLNEHEEQQSQFEYVGFWTRLVASIVDSILMMLITVPVLLWVYGDSYFTSEALNQGAMDAIMNYVFPLVATMAFWIYKMATPGKMLLSAKIVDADTGEKPTTGQFLIRYVGYFVSMLALFLGFLWVAWDSRKQGFHDKMANTIVVKS